MSRDTRQAEQLKQRRETLQSNLAQTGGPLEALNNDLQQQLTKRLEIETELRAAEAKVESNSQYSQDLSEQRDRLMALISEVKDNVQALQMERQEITVRQTTIKEQLAEEDLELETLINEMPEGAQLNAWEEQAEKVSTRISRLGPINLAAIDEYKTISERKEYQDKQQADLIEALGTLESAIRKIDMETRAKFKETFEKVNLGFQELFPKIFGGGRAILELTDEHDLLATGIMVRAQPPGKKNTTIHLLSGGEKALTAISLVFAMFRLNPAPFCILDEVDAPLDDLNVGRYCQLVKEMSKTTQFLVISHNKVTIESADHLIGITMQEPGVSRVVSVDMEEAIHMVEAA